jgi:hypothetical protein
MKLEPEKEIQSLIEDIVHEQAHWESIRENGCNDPFWTDGINMNLTRNHIIYAKNKITEICSETGLPLPAEYFTPTPPEVDKSYMAKPSMEQKERIERLQQYGEKLVNKCTAYHPEQLSLF